MKTSVLVVLCLLVATIADASPRDRRRARRAARQVQVNQNWTRSAPTNYVNYSTPVPISSVTPAMDPAPAVFPSKAIVNPANVIDQQTIALKPIVDQPAANAEQTTVALAPTPAEISSRPKANASAPILTADEIPTVSESPAAVPVPVPDPLPTVEETSIQEPFCASCQVYAPGVPFSSALAELNAIRAQRGLRPLIEDAALSAVAFTKASIQAARGAMFHPGGSMGGARFEGVGMGPRFTTCYQDATSATYAGAATVTGANGQRFHCLLLR